MTSLKVKLSKIAKQLTLQVKICNKFLCHMNAYCPVSMNDPENVKTVYDLFKAGLQLSPEEYCLERRISTLNAYSRELYYRYHKTIKTHRFMDTQPPEWTITNMASASQGLCNVALYETLGPDAVEYVINHAELELIVCTSNHLAKLLKLKATKLPILKVEDFGKRYPNDHEYPTSNDVFCIMYTSGTTGVPKGVMLQHGNFVAAVSAAKILFKTDEKVVAHCFGRVYEMTMLASGGKLGYIWDGIETLVENCQVFQPTFFGAVPRLLNKIYSLLAQRSIYAGGMTGLISLMAMNVKLRQLSEGRGCTYALWDRLLFNRMKSLLSGRVNVRASGAALLSHDVLQFLKVALCCDIREGYGATETTATGCLLRMGDNTAGSVGAPYVCMESKLADVPEMDDCQACVEPPKVEICMRGPSVFKGYFKDQEQTDGVLDKDGWYHSGDIGTFNSQGSLTVVDRKKNIFKLSQGEYIAPEKIENVFVKDPMVAQIFVHGEPLKSALIATGKAGGLQSYEIPKAIYLESKPFSIQKNLLTSSLKIKRHQAKKYYEKQLEKYVYIIGVISPNYFT
ncbi:hypothetical protein BDF20DRAFT_905042 [Mycotypha africana]|uniref:uncharacterized protein n=1 Tax=Mycotypha africana TaxID=64632 RepID=UPI002301D8BE|nr:uncharacterized protein BDF20DRAFT_905042 [Mycotypha africana]KAI8988480.1 hypothetical protein BDF20DRAFT_905042 [Mycotypha africana]